MDKVALRYHDGRPDLLIDVHACRTYAARARTQFDARLTKERQDPH
ncbi:MAG TPA: hypothetical protein VIM06_07825 [Rhodanobacter sp.]